MYDYYILLLVYHSSWNYWLTTAMICIHKVPLTWCMTLASLALCPTGIAVCLTNRKKKHAFVELAFSGMSAKAWKGNKPKKWYLFWEFTAIIWTLENTEGAIKNGQTRESGNIRRRQYVFGHHYAQTSTKYVNMTQAHL